MAISSLHALGMCCRPSGESALCSILRGAALLILLLLSGCGMPSTGAQIQATAEGELLQSFIDKLQAGDLSGLRMLIDPQANNRPDVVKALEQAAEIVPDESPKSTEFLNWWVNTDSASGRTSGVSAHLDYPTRWVLVTASFAGQPETMKVTAFRVDFASKGQDGASPFTSMTSAAGPGNIVNLAAVWISVAIVLAAAVTCLLVRGLNRLWMLLILIVTPSIYVEPVTGTYRFNFIDFGWADLSWFQPQSGWHIIVPLGAIVFFLKLWNRRPVPNQPASPGS